MNVRSIFVGVIFLFLTVASHAQVQKIVSLAPNLTEIVYALGLGSRMVGDTTACDYPIAAQKLTKVATYSDFNVERILSLGATVVLANAGRSQIKLQQLEALGIKILKIDIETLQDLSRGIIYIANNLSVSEQGKKLAGQINASIDNLRNSKHIGRSVFFALQFNPIYSISDVTWLGELFKVAGLRNIVGTSKIKYPIISEEFLIKHQPDIFLAGDFPSNNRSEFVAVQQAKVKNLYPNTYKKTKMLLVPKDVLVRPGPRIVEGIKFLESLNK